jgi:sirohydrochlorin cobaltochelatase
LAAWLAAGETRIGELLISGQYELRHHLDAGLDGLASYTTPQAAREIALYDAAGHYRPLKTAPNLRRGWRLTLPAIEHLHEALDAFYPAALALRLAFQQGRLAVTPLRDTLNRQSGIYAVTKKITDPQADALIGSFCRSAGGCLRTILWPISPTLPITSLPPEKFLPSPLLCPEACNLLIAKAREAVKS